MPRKKPPPLIETAGRIQRPLTLIAQVEQILREAIQANRFPGRKLPTEVELAEQLGVSRETVRRAAGNLEKQGLLVKYRRKGTFTQPPRLQLDAAATAFGYLQANYPTGPGQVEGVTRAISGLMLQGALSAAGKAGLQLIVRDASPSGMVEAFDQLQESARLSGVLFASYGEEKLLRRIVGLGLPIVLVDHDLHLPQVSSVRDDSQGGASLAVHSLAELGHRRIAFADWHRTDLNPWRLLGYRQGLRECGLPRRRTWEVATEVSVAGARKLVEDWKSLNPRPTALICFNNTLARATIDELVRQGFDVPGSVSIMGCGGEEVPGLTCHQADWYGMGAYAVGVLLRALEQGSQFKPEHALSPHVFKGGSTTGPPHAA